MKTSALLSLLGLLASSSALPADLHDRGFNFFSFPAYSFPGFGSFGAKTSATPSQAAATPYLPEASPTASTVAPVIATTSPPQAVSMTASSKATSTPASTPTYSSGSGSGSTGGSTENGIVNGECKELTVIFARGTTESGNVGTVSGPPMFKALRSSLGVDKVTIQGVDYPASTAGNANQGADGGPTMASLVKQALSQCPSTKIALSGYSQGGMVVHNAVEKQGVEASQIAAVVQFGDPMNGKSVGAIPAANLLEFCASGDSVCDGSGTFAITSAHMTYGNNAQQAADFIIKTAGVS